MTALRILLWLLVAINLGLAGVAALPLLGQEPLFMGTTEPDRMLNQLAPERLRLVEARTETQSEPAVTQAATESSVADSAPLAASAPEAASAVPASVPLAASAPLTANATATCVAFVHLTVAQSQSVAQRARQLSASLSVREEAPSPSSFWVNIPPQGGKAGAERRAAELKEIGLEDFFVVQEAGDNRFAISLGLFKAESLAERQLETLQKRGVKGARVTARINPNGARVEVSGSPELLERVAGEVAAAVKGVAREACAG